MWSSNWSKNEALGAFQEHSFETWQPDVVVVNLGTNDGGAFQSPEWKDEVTGESHKQRLNEDGTYHEDDIQAFVDAAEKFLMKLRKIINMHISYGHMGCLVSR